MRRLLLIFTTLMFGISQAAATPSALCRHASMELHVQALESADPQTAGQAHHEEAAAAAAKKLASLSDTAPAVAGAVLPEPASFEVFARHRPRAWANAPPDGLSDRAITPLLPPPLA